MQKTGRILLTSDACERGSVLQTMAAKITQLAFNHLDAPPVVVGAHSNGGQAAKCAKRKAPLRGLIGRLQDRLSHPSTVSMQVCENIASMSRERYSPAGFSSGEI